MDKRKKKKAVWKINICNCLLKNAIFKRMYVYFQHFPNALAFFGWANFYSYVVTQSPSRAQKNVMFQLPFHSRRGEVLQSRWVVLELKQQLPKSVAGPRRLMDSLKMSAAVGRAAGSKRSIGSRIGHNARAKHSQSEVSQPDHTQPRPAKSNYTQPNPAGPRGPLSGGGGVNSD